MRLSWKLNFAVQTKHKLINVSSKISLLTIISITLALFAAWYEPSLISLTAFLIALSLTGYRFVGLFSQIPFVQLTLAPLAGFSIVVVSILMPFATIEKMPLEVRFYIVSVIVGANLLLGIVHLFKNKKKIKKNQKFVSNDSSSNVMEIPIKGLKVATIIFLVALFTRLIFQSYNSSSILPDASMYFSAGRSFAESGDFSANILNDAPITSPHTRVRGLIPKAGTWMILGCFFSFGGVSFETNKLMLVVFGSLTIFPAILLHELWVGKRYWITGVLVAFHQTLF